MNETEKKQLRELAEKATPGPWNLYKDKEKYFTVSSIWSPHKHAWDSEDEEYNTICEFPRDCEYGYGCDTHIDSDADYIAAANPKAVLELLDENEKLKAKLDPIIPYIVHWHTANKRMYSKTTSQVTSIFSEILRLSKAKVEIIFKNSELAQENEKLRSKLALAEKALEKLSEFCICDAYGGCNCAHYMEHDAHQALQKLRGGKE
jgi:hypothetical protein